MAKMVSAHFSWDEVIVSSTAKAKGIDNSVPDDLRENVIRHSSILEQCRGFVGPMLVTSWYRCPELNRAIGGSKHSYHMEALATDFKTTHILLRNAFDKIAESGIKFDQLILEQTKDGARWIHIGSPRPSRPPRREVLIADGAVLGGHMNFTRVAIG